MATNVTWQVYQYVCQQSGRQQSAHDHYVHVIQSPGYSIERFAVIVCQDS